MPHHHPRHHHHHGPGHGPHHPHHHRAHRHPRNGHGQHEDALHTLRKLIDKGRIDDLPALIEAARDGDVDPTGRAAELLSNTDFEGLKPRTALELLSARWAVEAERSDEALKNWASDKRVVIIPPIPPHVFDLVCCAGEVFVVNVDGHHVPHFLRDGDFELVRKFHDARRIVGEADLIVFDAYQDGQVLARQSVVDLVGDLRTLKTGVKFAVHFRPHPDHDGDDVALPADVAALLQEV